jgi:hypothetical protein
MVVFSPYKTKSVELVMDWQNSSSSAKSNKEFNHLIHDVLCHPEFQLDELSQFNAACENCKADTAEENSKQIPLRRTHLFSSLSCMPLSVLMCPWVTNIVLLIHFQSLGYTFIKSPL